MEERKQNTSANANGCPQRDRTASEGYVGAQTYMEIVEGELVEMRFEGGDLMDNRICQPKESLQASIAEQGQMRSNGMGYQSRKEKMHQIIRGWIEYFRLADMQRRLKEIDEWLRRRYRMCIWKAWKKVRTKVKNLIKCGITEWQAYEWGNSSKKYWRVAGSGILHRAIGNEALRRQGWPCLMDYHRLIVHVQ